MLALKRKTGEKVVLYVGETTIEIVVEPCSGRKSCVLTFDAPLHVKILRSELVATSPAEQKMQAAK